MASLTYACLAPSSHVHQIYRNLERGMTTGTAVLHSDVHYLPLLLLREPGWW
jgi:hypothetical protein